ncbi:MAG: alpha/beta hydrolase [Cyanobacteria bacterium J06626_18]
MEHFNTYDWQGYRCAYDYYANDPSSPLVLLTIHPVGVGLSRQFWDRFCQHWQSQAGACPVYNPDLLGCGDSDRPRVAYYPEDWAAQLQHLIDTVIQRPVVLLVQGALFPVALKLLQHPAGDRAIHRLVLAGPPGWPLITQSFGSTRSQLLWNLFFDTPIGNAFFRYARREKFLWSFSKRQLFASEEAIDEQWLTLLRQGAGMDNRHAVFSFLAGFWRQDYTRSIEAIRQPTLVLFGEHASGIDQVSRADDAQKRLQDYLAHLPHGEGHLIPGRNVLPYETTVTFTKVLKKWLVDLPD